jgi:hypothetical protein
MTPKIIMTSETKRRRTPKPSTRTLLARLPCPAPGSISSDIPKNPKKAALIKAQTEPAQYNPL